MNSFDLRLLAADHPLYEGPCESLEFPTTDGQYGVQAHHSNMVAAVVPGIMRIRISAQETHIVAVSEGLIKIEDNRVLVLVDTAERPEEIDRNRAKLEKDRAREALLQKRTLREFRDAQAKIARELSRLKAADLNK